MNLSIVLRDLKQLSELLQLEQFQKKIWGLEDREVFPALAMVPLAEVGGVIVGAYAEDELVGFVLGFPGLENGRLTLHSDMLAVSPAYRSAGLGRQLKLVQRERALAKGIEEITWTFDPLQSLNAHFNFRKLGVTAHRYLPNFYGETTSFLHSTGTDRLWVRWDLKSDRVFDRISSDARSESARNDVPTILEFTAGGPKLITNQPASSQRFIDIPSNINELVKGDIDLAKAWRQATREVFTESMAEGFFVEDFNLIDSSYGRFGRYLLTRKG